MGGAGRGDVMKLIKLLPVMAFASVCVAGPSTCGTRSFDDA